MLTEEAPKLHDENVAACEEGYRCVDAQLAAGRRHEREGACCRPPGPPAPRRCSRPAHGAPRCRSTSTRLRRATPPARWTATSPNGSAGARERDFRGAWQILTRHNPFPAVAGRICHHPCEAACNRAGYDGVARDLPPRAACRRLRARGAAGRLPRSRRSATRARSRSSAAGPSGLSAAFHLRRRGYAVTVFESRPRAGRPHALRHPVVSPRARRCSTARSRASSRSGSRCAAANRWTTSRRLRAPAPRIRRRLPRHRRALPEAPAAARLHAARG